MQLHQEVRADRDVEGLGRMRDLQPGRDAADAADIDLHDRAGALLHVFAEMADRIERFADGDRRRGRAATAAHGRRCRRPAAAPRSRRGRARASRSARRIASSTAKPWLQSVMISKPSPTASRTADRRATSSEPCGLPILTFEPRKPLALAAQRVVDQRLRSRCAASRPRWCRAGSGPCAPPASFQSGRPCFLRAQVPERGVDGGERDRGDRADRRRMGGEFELVPDRLDHVGIARRSGAAPDGRRAAA